MSISTSRKSPPSPQRRGAHGGDGDSGGDEGGGGGGGGNGGRLVKVAFARTLPEAELIQGLLREADIPSVLRDVLPVPSGSYMPGPVDIMVAEAMAKQARQVLAETFVESEGQERVELEEERRLARGETGVTSPGKLAFWVGVAVLGGFLLVWLLYQIT
ncbi:MAG: putative signal transducing protein [Solirubrobacterales bacterium]